MSQKNNTISKQVRSSALFLSWKSVGKLWRMSRMWPVPLAAVNTSTCKMYMRLLQDNSDIEPHTPRHSGPFRQRIPFCPSMMGTIHLKNFVSNLKTKRKQNKTSTPWGNSVCLEWRRKFPMRTGPSSIREDFETEFPCMDWIVQSFRQYEPSVLHTYYI